MKLTNGMKVIAPSGCCEYLTEGKEYLVVEVDVNFENHFHIISDKGIKSFCRIKNCRHLNGGNWIIKQQKA